jgi:hypothetical protein
MIAKKKKILSIEDRMKEFEDKIRKQYVLQEKLDKIHKSQGTGQYSGSTDGGLINLDMSKVKKDVKEKAEATA